MSVYDRLRHASADEAAAEPATAQSFDALRGHKYCLLISYRRDGTPIAPVE